MNNQYSKIVGGSIRSIRLASHVTVTEVARRLGLSKPSVINIEKGRQSISVDQLFAFAEALNCGILDFFAWRVDDQEGRRVADRETLSRLQEQLDELKKRL